MNTTVHPEDFLVAGPYVNQAAATSARVLWVAPPGARWRCEVFPRGEGVSPLRAEGILPSIASSSVSSSSSSSAAAASGQKRKQKKEEARGRDARGTRGQDVRDTRRPAGVAVPVGELFKDEPVTATWRKTDAGYDLEFFLPAGALAPAAFEPGGTMGFDYVLRKGGRAVEQFIDGSRVAHTWACPFFWGKLRLAGK
jgi:hypothetical protein